MRSIGSISAAAAGPDPVSAPGNVTDALILTVPPKIPQSGGAEVKGVFGFTKAASGNVTVQLYVLDESTANGAKSTWTWRKFGDALVIPNDTALTFHSHDDTSVYFNVVPSGRVYPRVTAGNGSGITVWLGVG